MKYGDVQKFNPGKCLSVVRQRLSIRVMQLTLVRALLAVLSVAILLLFEWELYRGWKSCTRSPSLTSLAWGYADSTAVKDEFNSSRCDKTAPVSGRDLPRLFDGVEVFVMFIGYPRSGHSLVGSLLDAHPEIIVPHEYHLIQQWKSLYGSENKVRRNTTKYKLFYELFSLSERQALFGVRSSKATPCRAGGYCYHVPGAWQGTFRQRIRVIGNKQGGHTSAITPFEVFSYLEDLKKVTGIPLKLIHVVRNPFDNIATIALRWAHDRNIVRNNTRKINTGIAELDRAISFYFNMVSTNKVVLERLGNMVLTFKSHETITRPKETIQKLCDHLMVTCYQEYVEACANILYMSISVTRNSIAWPEDQKERVVNEMKKYWFLKDFNFENIP